MNQFIYTVNYPKSTSISSNNIEVLFFTSHIDILIRQEVIR